MARSHGIAASAASSAAGWLSPAPAVRCNTGHHRRLVGAAARHPTRATRRRARRIEADALAAAARPRGGRPAAVGRMSSSASSSSEETSPRGRCARRGRADGLRPALSRRGTMGGRPRRDVGSRRGGRTRQRPRRCGSALRLRRPRPSHKRLPRRSPPLVGAIVVVVVIVVARSTSKVSMALSSSAVRYCCATRARSSASSSASSSV